MHTPDRNLIERELKQAPVTCALPQKTINKLTAASKIEHYKLSTLLSSSGQKLTHLRLVLNGQIQLIARNNTGKESPLIEMGHGEWVTWLGCFLQQPPMQDFYSTPNTRCIAIPVNDVINIADNTPQLYRSIINEIGTRFRLLIDWSEQSNLLQGDKKLAKALVMRARFTSATQNTISIPITQDKLAQLANISRQTANVFLQELQTKGLISLGYRKINIPSVTLLDQYTHNLDH